jgi:hypothetical protein
MPKDFLEIMEQLREENLHPSRFDGPIATQRANPRYAQKLAEALRLISRAEKGDQFALYTLREVMTTSDFSQITGDVLNRTMLAQYQAYQPIWNRIANPRTVADFRNVRSVVWGELNGILPTVPEQTEYPAAAFTDAGDTWSVAKHGIRVPFSWELAINDDLGALRRIPALLGQQARRSEDYLVTDLFAGASGPDGTVYSVGNTNIITGNPALSIEALQTAFTVLGNMRDAEGNPIMVDSTILVVPPALKVVAENILNATQIMVGTDSAAQRLVTNNWMRNSMELVVDPYLPIISSTANGSTSWYLFANPNNGRPAIDFGRLRGHEEPEIRMKSPDSIRVGGGAIDPFDGDFDTDTIQYRLRHSYGGTIVEEKMTVASNGSGS